jgi:hypothetical protein
MELHLTRTEAEQLDRDGLLRGAEAGRHTLLLGPDRQPVPVKVVVADPSSWSWATPR